MWQLPPLKPEEILIYLRKSRADDASLTVEEVLAKHEQMLNEWVERHLPGLGPVPEENRFREIVSGETIDSRPEVQAMLRKVESPRYKAVLVVEPQRLSRGDLEDIGRLVKLLRFSNTLALTPPYNYDLRDERDRDQFERELKRGNDYLEYTKKIMYNGRLLSVENGNYLGTVAPYGYKKIAIKEGKRKCHTLEIIPEEARIVKLIFEMYRDGIGSHAIARKLNEMAVPTAKGEKWSPESLKRMRTNHHYLGKVRWNYRTTVKSIEDGEVVESRPLNSDYLIYPGKHEAIIDQELWDAAQAARNHIAPVKGKAKHANPYAGLVFCQCGRTMSRRTYKNKSGERAPARLLCDNQVYCKTPSCTVDEMTEKVIKALERGIKKIEVQMEKAMSDSVALNLQLIEQYKKRLEELNKQEISQWEKYTMEGMPKHIFDQLNEKVLMEKHKVQEALCTMENSIPEPIDYEMQKNDFEAAINALKNPKAPVREQNMLLKQCITKIKYTREPKKSGNRRWGEPEEIHIDVDLTINKPVQL